VLKSFYHRVVLSLLIVAFSTVFVQAQTGVPTPRSVLGFEPTTERTIADWRQISDYFAKLDAASGRVKVEQIGTTTLNKPFIVAFISSEENIRNLDKYKAINAKIADPRTVKNDAEREQLLAKGKSIVAISCSIHSTEIVPSQMSMNLAYELATKTDEETKQILDNTILLLIPSANPDGIDIVADWYRKTLGTPYEGTNPPELYHHYAGHDNNRDWFMLNLKETRLVTDLFWKNWYPQIVYDIHQMGQTGARFIIPPFYDPPNPNIHPWVLREVGTIGYKMAADLQANNRAGVATNAYFDTWWHGGFRSTPYYHNSIGILSEAASADLMTPKRVTVEMLKNEQKRRGLDSPLQSATNHPKPWSGGVWSPRDIAAMQMVTSRSVLEMAAKFRANYLRNFYELNRFSSQPDARPEQPLAYVIPAGQPNEENVVRMIEVLISQGIEVYKMNRELHVAMPEMSGKMEIPLNSYVVFTAQPQRANVQALFERQVYPNRITASGEPDVPYDVAGWTLPLQMGVETMIITEIAEPQNERGLEKVTDINTVRRTLAMKPTNEPFAKAKNPLAKTVKVGLYKSWTASMDEGWTRLVFDNFQIPYKSIYDADVRKGDLRTQFDAIILPSMSDRTIVEGFRKGSYPDEFTGGIGEAGAENLKKFVEAGGTLICFDDSCEMAIKRFGLPLKNSLDSVKRSDFYCPGSILQLEVDASAPLAKGLTKQTPAYFINSSAFELTDANAGGRVKVVARYAEKNALMSGWLLGEKYLNSKIALAEISVGQGKVVAFAFRPQHRGQTWATFPFIFNALSQ
jgi:hypothetical protein